MFRILWANNKNDYREWLSIWYRWEGKEIFAHPDYLSLYSQWSEAVCAVYSSGDRHLLFPFCMREIAQDFSNETYYDIITPYGYGDIYLIGKSDFISLEKEFNDHFHQWAMTSKVVSGFIRFDLFSRSIDDYKGDVIFNTNNIACDLTKGDVKLWEEFKPKVRRNIRKAMSCDLKVEIDVDGDRLDSFLGLYY
ncbi:MAG: hypothetical protein JEZ14_19790, partial [Marinilabiliaceae bacterium]|nr:hypothetical protein [Marinilabiliaceae bacterium]